MCGSWPNSGSGSGKKSRLDPAFSGCPVVAAVDALEHAAAGQADVEMRRVARIDDDRVQHRSVGRLVLRASRPRSPTSGGRSNPVTGAHVSPPSSLRKRPCGDPPAYQTPGSSRWPGLNQTTELDASLERVAFGERGGPGRFLPRLAQVVRPEHGRAEVAGPRRDEQRLAVAWVEHHVLDDLAEEDRARSGPTLTRLSSGLSSHAPLRVPIISMTPSSRCRIGGGEPKPWRVSGRGRSGERRPAARRACLRSRVQRGLPGSLSVFGPGAHGGVWRCRGGR